MSIFFYGQKDMMERNIVWPNTSSYGKFSASQVCLMVLSDLSYNPYNLARTYKSDCTIAVQVNTVYH